MEKLIEIFKCKKLKKITLDGKIINKFEIYDNGNKRYIKLIEYSYIKYELSLYLSSEIIEKIKEEENKIIIITKEHYTNECGLGLYNTYHNFEKKHTIELSL